MKTEKEILIDFKNKHNYDVDENDKTLQALIRYVELIAYNEGWKDRKENPWLNDFNEE